LGLARRGTPRATHPARGPAGRHHGGPSPPRSADRSHRRLVSRAKNAATLVNVEVSIDRGNSTAQRSSWPASSAEPAAAPGPAARPRPRLTHAAPADPRRAVGSQRPLHGVLRDHHHPGDLLDRHPLGPIQPTNLRPVLHGQHFAPSLLDSSQAPRGVNSQASVGGRLSRAVDTTWRSEGSCPPTGLASAGGVVGLGRVEELGDFLVPVLLGEAVQAQTA
jgi:hypothetical protein